MPEIPTKGDVYASPTGDHYQVLSVHPPFITARRKRGWAATLMSGQGTLHLVEMSVLEKGGFTTAKAPR